MCLSVVSSITWQTVCRFWKLSLVLEACWQTLTANGVLLFSYVRLLRAFLQEARRLKVAVLSLLHVR